MRDVEIAAQFGLLLGFSIEAVCNFLDRLNIALGRFHDEAIDNFSQGFAVLLHDCAPDCVSERPLFQR